MQAIAVPSELGICPYGICFPWVRGGQWGLDALGKFFRRRRRCRRRRPSVKVQKHVFFLEMGRAGLDTYRGYTCDNTLCLNNYIFGVHLSLYFILNGLVCVQTQSRFVKSGVLYFPRKGVSEFPRNGIS